MSHIDEMIDQLCPGGVPFVPMWKITTWDKRFNAVERFKQPRVEKYKYLLAKELSPLVVEHGDVKILTTNESNLWTAEDLVDGPIYDAEIIAIPWGGNAVVQYFSGRFVTSDNRIAVVNNPDQLDAKFLYYFISNNLGNLASFYRGSGIKHPSMAKVLDWPIPVPPLEVQREIVRVLDQFTALEAELEAELEARRHQLSYYRSSTLGENRSDIKIVLLGDIADFKYGFTDKAANEGTHRFLRITDINAEGKLSVDGAKFVSPDDAASDYVVRRGDLLMARTGATYGKTMLVDTDDPAVYASFLIRIRFKESQMLPAYYWHYAQSSEYWDQAKSLVSAAGQPQFNANALKSSCTDAITRRTASRH